MKIEGNRVLGVKGDVLAEKIYGEWHTKDADVLKFIEDLEQEELVRARDGDGKFIPDDPKTEINEAWVKKPRKKRATKK